MRHPFHLVEQSPWPIFIALNLLFFLIGFVSLLNGYLYSVYTFYISISMVIIIFYFWLYDIISESLYIGAHSYKTLKSLIIGFLLFLLTEIMLFFSFFWAYFHSALNPLYLIWPPIGISLINPWAIPLVNTFLLFYSGVLSTVAHHSFLSFQRNNTLIYLFFGIILGILFFLLQVFEYFTSSFDITDSVYGSSFFLLTGAHGLHVIVGVSFLIAILIRVYNYHNANILFDMGLLYYHLIDLVWLLLFILIYYLAY
jgi:cytochrome c oxidase subunit 3